MSPWHGATATAAVRAPTARLAEVLWAWVVTVRCEIFGSSASLGQGKRGYRPDGRRGGGGQASRRPCLVDRVVGGHPPSFGPGRREGIRSEAGPRLIDGLLVAQDGGSLEVGTDRLARGGRRAREPGRAGGLAPGGAVSRDRALPQPRRHPVRRRHAPGASLRGGLRSAGRRQEDGARLFRDDGRRRGERRDSLAPALSGGVGRERRPWLLLGLFGLWEFSVVYWNLRSYTAMVHVTALLAGFLAVRYPIPPTRRP